MASDIQEIFSLYRKLAVPCIGLNLLNAKQEQSGATMGHHTFSKLCHIGGRPLVPEDFKWPYDILSNDDDEEDREAKLRPYSFIAQFDLSEIHPFDVDKRLPDHGLLLFFYAFGSYEANAYKVIYIEDFAPEQLVYADFPPEFNNNENFCLKEHGVFLFNKLSLPDYVEFDAAEKFEQLSEQEQSIIEDNIDEIMDLLSSDVNLHNEFGYDLAPTAKFLGYGNFIQDDACEKPEDLVLFELKSFMNPDNEKEWEVLFGDAGSVYFMISPENLSKRDFSKAYGDMQCY